MKSTKAGGRLSIKYGQQKIAFDVLLRDRKTLSIVVYPDKSVVVKAPLGTSKKEVIRRVCKHARWIKKQILYFEQFEPRTPPRRYVGGESHLYLGRKYRLKIEKAKSSQVLLRGGFFHIKSPAPSPRNVEMLLEDWYRQKAFAHFGDVLESCWGEVSTNGAAKPQLKIRKMKTRWGSISTTGGLTLNLELIKAPKECIEYVVIHELCHLSHPNHSPSFYRLMDASLPDWTQRKHKLETSLA